MSALAMMLAAALVAGSAPEKVSGEVEQRLDLRGEWRGTFIDGDGFTLRARFSSQDGLLIARTEKDEIRWAYKFEAVDEKHGNFRTEITALKCLGVYEWRANCLLLCYRSADAGRPTALKGGSGQFLLILRRVKPRK